MGKATDDEENESRGFEDVALTPQLATVLKSRSAKTGGLLTVVPRNVWLASIAGFLLPALRKFVRLPRSQAPRQGGQMLYSLSFTNFSFKPQEARQPTLFLLSAR
jgi:hypothetical protein